MYQYLIVLKIHNDIAKQILTGLHYKLWLIKARAFLNIIVAKVGRKYLILDDKDMKILQESSEDIEYLKKQKQQLDDFLNSDYETLKEETNKAFEGVLNDRWIQTVNTRAHKLSANIKNKAIFTALGSSNILGFFNAVGIAVTTQIKQV